jgi:hypothetical protein
MDSKHFCNYLRRLLVPVLLVSCSSLQQSGRFWDVCPGSGTGEPRYFQKGKLRKQLASAGTLLQQCLSVVYDCRGFFGHNRSLYRAL